MDIQELHKLEKLAKKSLPTLRKNYDIIAKAKITAKKRDELKNLTWDDIEYCLFTLGRIDNFKKLKITSFNGNTLDVTKIEDNWDKILDVQLAILILLQDNKNE